MAPSCSIMPDAYRGDEGGNRSVEATYRHSGSGTTSKRE